MKESTLSWVEFAKRDLEGAKQLLDNEYLANLVLFHSQQAVEKIVKALLEEYSIDIPRVHSILKLYRLLPSPVIERVSIDENDLEMIDQIYIDSRYPADMGILPSGFPTKDEALTIFKIAGSIFECVSKEIPR